MSESMSDERLGELEKLGKATVFLSSGGWREVRELVTEVHRSWAVIDRVRDLHQPKRDHPMSMIRHEFCSCGAMEVQDGSDGYPIIAPAKYPCATIRALDGIDE